MNKYLLIILGMVSALGLASCRKDGPDETPKLVISQGQGGVFVVNEGNFQFGNAEVSYYNPTTDSAIEDMFSSINNRPLGDVLQSISFFNNKAYLVVNNSGKIEVVNSQSFASIAIISGLVSPRYMLPVSNNKAYVSDYASNSISILDLNSNSVIGNINCPGWTENIVLAYGHALVTNQKSDKLYSINTASDIIEDSLNVGFGANSIKEDKNGKLWVLCKNRFNQAEFPSLKRINPITMEVEQSFAFTSTNDEPWRLTFNPTNDTLYFLNKQLYRMAITEPSLPSEAFVNQTNSNFYGLGIDPSSGTIYIADAIDYVQRGVIFRYDTKGNLLGNFKAGIIPSEFYWH